MVWANFLLTYTNKLECFFDFSDKERSVTFNRHSSEIGNILIEERLNLWSLSGQTCIEFAVVYCHIPERVSHHLSLMSLLVKGWKNHRLSIKADCQSQTVSNISAIYTSQGKNRMVLKCCLLCSQLCSDTNKMCGAKV